SAAASRAGRSSTSARKPRAPRPSARKAPATASAASRRRSRTATLAPHSARALAIREHSTPPPPVTTATLPERSILKGTVIGHTPVGSSVGGADPFPQAVEVDRAQ